MKLTNKTLESLIKLVENTSIDKKNISNNKLLNKLQSCNAVEITSRPAYILLKNEVALYKVLESYGYRNLNIEKIKEIISTRDNLTNKLEDSKNFTDSKKNNSKSFSGIMLSTLKPITLLINNRLQMVDSIDGSGLFFHESIDVQIPKEIILVGVENPQCVWFIKKLNFLFDGRKDYVFLSLSEFKTSFQYGWLEKYSGEYLHFGDFDLPAIKNIFQGRILPRLKKCKSSSYFIPNGLYEYMKKRNYKNDYSKQLGYYNTYSEDEELQKLIQFIKDNKITLEQENLYELDNENI